MIASELGYSYVDTGAMYRSVTLYCMKKGLFDQTEEPAPQKVNTLLNEIHIEFRRNKETGMNETWLSGQMVEKQIRSMEVSGHVSYISTIPEVRERMVDLQREMGKNGGVVMDGRDIGTVVYPDADIKIFMTANPEIRAERRRLELEQKGVAANFSEVKMNIEKRDRIDSGRKTSPLKQAPDAVLLDNSNMTVEAQMEWLKSTFAHVLQ